MSFLINPACICETRDKLESTCRDLLRERDQLRDEIRRLESVLIHEAAELARLLHHEDITDSLYRTIYPKIQRMKSAGLDGA
jgi:hypothetical protein